MSKALQIYTSDLTPLQKAAIDKIHDFQKELKEKYGFDVRSAIELEFMVEDDDGNMMSYILNLDRISQQLRQQRLPYFERLQYENQFPDGTPGNAFQYEINFSDHAWHADYAAKKFAPAEVAAATAQFKAHTLQEILNCTSCLRTSSGFIGRLHPNFSPAPYHTSVNLDTFNKTKDFNMKKYADTSAMHINISLYDQHGVNLFSESPDLFNQCALSLVKAQNEAGLCMVPDRDSHARLMFGKYDLNGTVPGGLGIRNNKNPGDDKYSSVRRRIQSNWLPTTRIENRLPGADADPFVAMAVTIAALVDAVRAHVHEVKPGEKVDPQEIINDRFIVDKATNDALKNTHEILPDHDDMIKKYVSSTRMRDLLGKELYDAIATAYAAAPAMAH